jgi:DinB superfamily
MPNPKATRSARLADQFEAAQESFIGLVESLTVEHWRAKGKNTPELRINDEDESRTVGVIAHHVAVNQDWIMNRIKAIIEDKPTPPVDFKEINAHHANEHAHATRAEVLALLRDSKPRIAKELRAIRDHELDKERELPTGTMTVQQRIERVLIGHMKSHQGSIETTIS